MRSFAGGEDARWSRLNRNFHFEFPAQSVFYTALPVTRDRRAFKKLLSGWLNSYFIETSAGGGIWVMIGEWSATLT
jgi:hypothetical protein